MMRRILGVAAILLLIGLPACGRSDLFEGGSGQRDAVTISRYAPPPEPVPESAVAARSMIRQGQVVSARSLIRTVDLELSVDDPEAAAAAVRDLTASLGGYVGFTEAQLRRQVPSHAMTLHVPAADLDDAVGRIRELAIEVRQHRLHSEDVTERLIDVEARLTTLRATEEELLGLLDSAGDSGLEDVVAVYRELTGIRTDIERYEARLTQTVRQVEMATINLSLESAAPATAEATWSAVAVARRSAATLVAILQALASFAIFVVIAVLPAAAIVALPIWATHRLWLYARPRST